MKAKRGLTLIEVILAVAILGVCMTVLLASVSRCLAAIRTVRDYQAAQAVLGLGEVDHPLVIGDDIEDLNVDPVVYFDRYTFSREVEEKDSEEEDGLYILRTRIDWTDRGRKPVHEVVRYVYHKDK